jgi:ABC-type dipeptide/oligopeptide/nickel transport system permease subunit
MLYQAQASLATEPWLAVVPGVFILLTTVSVNMIGDGLTDSLGSPSGRPGTPAPRPHG